MSPFPCLATIILASQIFAAPRTLQDALRTVHRWKYMDYDFGSDERRQAAIQSGAYNYTSSAPIDVDRWRDLTFVTVIRNQGVPSSLNVVSKKNGPGGPLLRPYPDWTWTNITNCLGIVSVYRVAIDKCDRLWVLDTGIIGDDSVCPAKLLAFDLHTSTLLRRAEIPDSIARNASTGHGLLVTPLVQTLGQHCEDVTVYIADAVGHGLIIYDGKSFRRIESAAFVNDPRATVYTIQGHSFELEDGIVGMAISPRTQNLYFSPMSSFNLASVSTQALRVLAADKVQYRVARDILWTQASAKAMSRTGALFFGLVNDTSIGCWNERKPLVRQSIEIVAQNPITLQFTSGMKIKTQRDGEELWAFTNRYQRLATGTVDYDDFNFRILRARVTDLIQATLCSPTSSLEIRTNKN